MASTHWWALLALYNQEVESSDLKLKSVFKSSTFSFLGCMQTSLPFEHSTSHNSCFAVNVHLLENWGCLLVFYCPVLYFSASTSSWAKLLPFCFQYPSTGRTISHQNSILRVLLFLLVAVYPNRLNFICYFILSFASPFCKRYISTAA